MNKIVYTIITLSLLAVISIIFFGNSKNNTRTNTPTSTQNIQTKDGIQYITINAKGGYYPNISTAKSGMQTKLIIKTDGTYDCSASLVIRSIGFQKILAQTGEEAIDLGTPKAGQSLQGICGMGMYNFTVNFN